MVHRKAFAAPVAVSGGLLVLLLAGACGKPTAGPEPVVIPTIPSSPVPVTSVPAVAEISVRPAATTPPPPPPPTVAATTEPPPPEPPPQVQPPPPPPPPTVQPTKPAPSFDDVALEGFPCHEEGATAVDPAGRDLVCQPTRRGKLRWQGP